MCFLFGLYITLLFLFISLSNLLHYCICLILSSFVLILLVYFSAGVFWYSLLLYLVYIGGIYVLLLFVSLNYQNLNLRNNINYFFYVVLFFSLSFLFWCYGWNTGFTTFLDPSLLLVSQESGFFYLFLCLLLLVGFIFISHSSNNKESFLR
uniref:NADH dehydrogenase subunit 6 n=1 Tax=Tetraonchus monenteron TaxID=198446 RepID=UPI001436C62A|nr:NADH dehydrogenase subunit 6 [Tetraonchus monenteron]QIH29918.1 NADH dehydrogenase subunit 6 [Tetraonchus monenteron]